MYSILTWRWLLETTLCDKVCQLLSEGRWVLQFPPPIKTMTAIIYLKYC